VDAVTFTLIGRIHCPFTDPAGALPQDITSHVPRFDARRAGWIGWVAANIDRVEHTRADGRFAPGS
jgi:hypothetical protein